MYDLLILGGGPAGVSAALTAYQRGCSVLLLSNAYAGNPLSRAPLITNYPGMPAVSGRRMLDLMYEQIRDAEIPVITQKVVQVLRLEDRFVCAGRRRGLRRAQRDPGCGMRAEGCGAGGGRFPRPRRQLLCDVRRNAVPRPPRVAVSARGRRAGGGKFPGGYRCTVSYFGRGKRPAALREPIAYHQAVQYLIHGDEQHVTGLEADGFLYPADGIFILRPSMAADSLVPGLQTAHGHITVDAAMAASIPGVFAAGTAWGGRIRLPRRWERAILRRSLRRSGWMYKVKGVRNNGGFALNRREF